MDKVEHEELERTSQKLMENICIVTSLGRILEEIYVNRYEVKPVDIEYLIKILNSYIKITKSKLNDFEMYLMAANK